PDLPKCKVAHRRSVKYRAHRYTSQCRQTPPKVACGAEHLRLLCFPFTSISRLLPKQQFHLMSLQDQKVGQLGPKPSSRKIREPPYIVQRFIGRAGSYHASHAKSIRNSASDTKKRMPKCK